MLAQLLDTTSWWRGCSCTPRGRRALAHAQVSADKLFGPALHTCNIKQVPLCCMHCCSTTADPPQDLKQACCRLQSKHTATTCVSFCAGTSFEENFNNPTTKFNIACQTSAVPLVRDASVVKEYLKSLFAGDDNEVFPYGVDPAFLRSSDALYKPGLQGKEGWYYNTSDPGQVPPSTKAPYGFFHRHLKVQPG